MSDNDKLTLENGEVVKATFQGLGTQGESQYGKWYMYSLTVDGKDVVFFANDKNRSTFDGLEPNDEFSFGKVKHESDKGIYHKVERVGETTKSTTQKDTTSSQNGRSFSTREASIVSGVAVKVAGWSCSPTTFSEEELYKRAKIVLSVLNKLETDLLHKNVEELFGATDDE